MIGESGSAIARLSASMLSLASLAPEISLSERLEIPMKIDSPEFASARTFASVP